MSSTCVVTKVKGSLKKCLHACTEINAPKFITDIILHGYKIPFMSIPPSFRATNNKSALREREFVEKAIGELLLHECIIEVASQPDIVNPLSVFVQQSGEEATYT